MMPEKKIYYNVKSLTCSHLGNENYYECGIKNKKITLEGKKTNMETLSLSSLSFGGIDVYIPIKYNAGLVEGESFISILFSLKDQIKCELEKSSLYCSNDK